MSQWLHKEGNWYLMSKEQCHGEMDGYDYAVFIWHNCPRYNESTYKGCWRISRHNLDQECWICQERCPAGIQALWTMMNMDIKGN